MILKSVIHFPDTNAVEATWIDEEGQQVKCHTYANVQMDMLEADLGADAAQYADLIATVRANIKPPAPENIAKAKAERWEAIKAEREWRKSGGVKVGSEWFHSDTESRIQHIGLNMLGSNIPAGLQWKTMDGTFVTMTQSLANQIFGAVMALDMQAHAVAENHRVAMEASADPQNYDYAAGWPAIYSES